MAYLAKMNRFQTRIISLEEALNKDNPVCFVDAFVVSLIRKDLHQKSSPKKYEYRQSV